MTSQMGTLRGVPWSSNVNTAELKKKVEEKTILTISSGYVKIAVVLLFFGLSVLFYHIHEGWGTADCFLFVIITISTVGYGTISPTTQTSRIYTIFLMVFGVVAIFSTLTAIVYKGMKRLNIVLAKSVITRLRKSEEVFQQRFYLSICWIVLCAFLGAVVLQQLEGWDYISSLYFIIETITTVGYGDFTVQQESTKIFLCFYIILSVTLLGLSIQNLYALLRNRKVLAKRKELLQLQRKLHFLADLNDGRGVGRFEFVLTILEHIGTLDHDKDIAPWLKKFAQLDTYDSGILNQQQLAYFSEKNEEECEAQIELLALSASNLQALRAATSSVGAFQIPRSGYLPYLSGHGEAGGNGSTGEDPDGDPEGGPDGTAHCASLYSGSTSVQGVDREGEYDYSSSCGGGEALEEGKSCYEEEQIPYRSASSNGGGSAVTYSVLHRGSSSQGGREREYYREQRNRPIPRTKTRQRNYSTVTNISDLAASTGDAGSDRGSPSPPPLLTTPKHLSPPPPVVPAVGSWLSRPPLRPLPVAGLGIGETLFPGFPSSAMKVTQKHSATTSPLHGTVAAVVDKTSCSISGSGGKRGIVVLGRNNDTTTASGTTTVIAPVSGSFIV